MKKILYRLFEETTAVYLFRCIPTSKVYIGSTTSLRTRVRNHLTKLYNKTHENDYLQNSWNKYGREHFEFLVLHHNIDDYLKLEEKYIEDFKSWNRKFGFNIERYPSDKSGEQNPFYGKTHTDETKLLLSELAKQKTGDKNSFYGRKHSSESIKKMIKATGRFLDNQVLDMRHEFINGKSISKLAKENKLSYQSMWDLVNYKTYRHLTPEDLEKYLA